MWSLYAYIFYIINNPCNTLAPYLLDFCSKILSSCQSQPPMCAKLLQSYPTLCNAMDCSLPGSSVHGISQARIWSGLPFPSLGDLSDLGIEPKSPALAGGFFTTSATWEALPIFRPSGSISALSGISFSVYSLSFIAFCSSEALRSTCGLTLPEKFSASG